MSLYDEQALEFELCHESDLQNDTMKEFEISLDSSKKAQVLLVKYNDEFYSIGAKCSHYGVPLSKGVLFKGKVRCMAHGACFDAKTGDIEDYPGVDCLPKFDVYVNSAKKVVLKATRKNLEQQKRPRKIPNIAYNINQKKLEKIVIIGSGAAGLICMDTLRAAGFGSHITIITKENWNPYDRPKLSKALDLKIDNISLKDNDYFAINNINFAKNELVEKIDFNQKLIECKSGQNFEYHKLIIATGLVPLQHDSKPGHHLRGVFTLRSYDDAQNIIHYFNTIKLADQNDLNKKMNIVAVGGSFIAMEALSYFADKANTISMSRNQPFERIFGTLVSSKIRKLHESKNVKFIIDKNFDIVEFKESKEHTGCLESIKLNDGSIWPVDICILAIGSKPATDFLKNTSIKLSVDNYVYVNEHMKTNIQDVFAVGDIALFPRSCLAGLENTSDRNSKLDHVNVGHWGVASQTGRVAAESIINNNDKNHLGLKTVPFFWSVHHGKMIRFAGFNEKFDMVIFHEDKTNQNEFKLAAFYLLNDKVVGVATVDWDPVCAVFAEALNDNRELKREDIIEDPMNIQKCLKTKHSIVS